MRNGKFFKVGRVFATLYTEAAGAQANHSERNDDTFTQVKFGQLAYSTIRRFIVVNIQHGFVYAWCVHFILLKQTNVLNFHKRNQHILQSGNTEAWL